jgi:hypothetical protein
VFSGSNFDDVAITDIQRVASDFWVLIGFFAGFFRLFNSDVRGATSYRRWVCGAG